MGRRCLEALGHEMIVADPNFAPRYATRTRKVKTDRRDARAQAEALRTWALRIAARRGKQVAVVALARRLAGILYALLRDGSVFEPQRVRSPRRPAAGAAAPVSM